MTGENRAINAMRTLAALAVVVGHLRILVFRDYDEVPHTALNFGLYGITALGHQAVVVFFVLSGFWVGGAVIRKIQRDAFTWRPYLTARLTRLWLVLIPALLLTAACDLIGRHFYADHSTYQGSAAYGGVITAARPIDPVAFLGNAAFLQRIDVLPYGTNAALWSLSYEFWFYMLFPVVALVLAARKSRLLWAAVAVGIGVFVGWTILSYFPLWCLGAVVAWFQPQVAEWLRKRSPGVVAVLRLTSAGGLLVTALAVRGVNSLPVTLGDYVVAVPAAVLLATLVTDVRLPGLADRLLDGLSVAAHRSYSLYAIHVPVIVLLVSALGIEVGSRWPADLLHGALFVALLAVPVTMAWGFAAVTEMRTNAVRRRVDRAWSGQSDRETASTRR